MLLNISVEVHRKGTGSLENILNDWTRKKARTRCNFYPHTNIAGAFLSPLRFSIPCLRSKLIAGLRLPFSNRNGATVKLTLRREGFLVLDAARSPSSFQRLGAFKRLTTDHGKTFDTCECSGATSPLWHADVRTTGINCQAQAVWDVLYPLARSISSDCRSFADT